YAAATYTANRQFTWGVNAAEHQASPGYLYAKLLETDSLNCGSGTYIQTAMDLLIQAGCSSLGTVEYRDDMCFDSPSAADAANFRVGSYNRIQWTDRNTMRGELAAGRIIVFGATLYDDFAEFTGSGVYQGSGVLLTQGEQHAAHAMAVVGYDDTRGAYRIMNSWSSQWGDNGFMWMAYETFEATAYEAYSTEPRGDREPPNPEPGPGPEPTPGPDPAGYLDEAYQFAEVDAATGQTMIYLVFFYHFDEAVFIRTITVTDPFDASASQAYEVWYSDGYVYFVRDDDFQWQSGTYTLTFETDTQAGNSVTYSGEVEVKPLGEGDGGGGTCLNTCFFAFDGECDDGGAGSVYAVCDHGTDCYDCGVRDADVDDGDIGTGGLCTDDCAYAFDGECDDGGPGSMYSVCEYGTDCTDCGPRSFDGGAKVIQTPHVFRGVPVTVPAEAARLPAAGVRPGVLGANRRPAEVTPANSE
ncbi:MAG TPA: C1 family peptidase, partial [Phycisphaerae bacterium]|nr:C1 family peptidase [Phycisphaerae bacterium]